ncbi:MAG TPA: MFS transporter, partial [Acidimicrobiales bacterium]|nr:MFS transporter [Acidimicrobiales bacterium]
MRLSRSPRPRGAGDGALRALVLLAVSHGVDDLSQGVVLGLVPVFVATRHYSYAGGTAIVLAGTLMPALLEPVFGMATDRRTLPWLPEAGMAVSGLGVGLAGLAGSYPLTLAAIALSGLGVAAYHPEAGRAVRAATPSATAMGWFTFAGLSGFAVGPLALAAIDATLGPSGIPVLMGPALTTAAVLAVVRRPERRRAARPQPRHEGPAPAGQEDRRGFAWLLGVVLARSVLLYGVSALAGLYLIRDLGASVAL